MDYAVARRKALSLLTLQQYHSEVLARKLLSKGCSPEVCNRVLEECRRMGLLQDEEAILQQFRRGYGPRYIEAKLFLKKGTVQSLVTREMQRQKIEELSRKWKEGKKAIPALLRRGFDLDLILQRFSREEGSCFPSQS